jgi:hypothetical protein
LSIFFGTIEKIKKGLTNDIERCIIQHVKARASLRGSSQRRFLFTNKNTYNLIQKGKGVFCGAGKSAMKAILVFFFSNWKEWDYEECIGFFRM